MISIYIAAYIRIALPALASQVYKDNVKGELQDYICVIDNGFKEDKVLKRRDYSIQVLVASTSDQLAKEKAYQVYGILSEKYNFSFPAPAGTANSALSVQSIRTLQAPQGLGKTGSVYMYTIHYEITGGNYTWLTV